MDKVEDGFTTGPWKATRSSPAEGYDCWWITANHRQNYEKDLATVAGGASTSAANAKLIAAAPDMYAALERLEAHCRILPPDMDEPGSPLAQARAALLLARKAGDQS